MSTNYYLKRIPTKEEISQCHQLLDERKIEYCDRYGEGYDAPYLEQVLEKMTETLHIGSHSGGWRFLFRIHDDLYERSILSCLDYLLSQLNTGLWRIMDEYGRTVTLADLEKIVRNSLSGITIEDYHKTHPEDKQWYRYGPPQIIANDGSIRAYKHYFREVYQIKEMRFRPTVAPFLKEDLGVVMCHYPMVTWNQKPRGSIMLHGHSHGKLDDYNALSPDLRFDVGIDGTLANLHILTLEDIYNAAYEKITQAGCTTFVEYASNNYKSEVR